MHRTAARALTPLAVALAVAGAAGCGGGSPAAEPGDPVTLTAELVDGEVVIPEEAPEVPRGTEVTLQVTSDAPVEVHVHGFDEYVRLDGPGTGETTFTADLQGVFEIETHDTGLLIYRLAVR
ncbi:hypothetical protein [Aquipuribacter sp. SD81]|uniref:hypothetical protein n=1 Tax=Aquipuribacter sp. SD81 TaxID=3127703 RepID=UPI003016CAC4